ncbi:MAG: GIY-YIG nuclease family protein [Dehalococcoidia bacterium]|nr:GIY-YIG nuclease family protein [Dehalococcoidia bacterium]
MYTVYVLRSATTGRRYVGQTENLDRRLHEHQSGLAGYTKGRGPWLLLHREEYPTRREAMQRERFLKSGVGREWLKRELDGRAGPPEAD